MNYSFITTINLDILKELKCKELYKQFDISSILEKKVDLHLVLLENNEPVARASLWWSDTPKIDNQHVGTVGQFASLNESSAIMLLNKAVEILKNFGINTIIGPMDGNTWRSYRFITNRGTEPIFFLEPDNVDEYPNYFLKAGFNSIEEYESAVQYDLTIEDKRLKNVLKRLEQEQITIRNFNKDNFYEEINKIYDISVIAFENNVLYTPMSKQEFIKQYSGLRELIVPQFVLIVEDKEKNPVGFVFAVPDFNQAKNGEKIDTVILKTLAVLPDRKLAGLGSVLLDKVVKEAYKMNFKKAIYALMHKSNTSKNIAHHFAKTFRIYTLYGKR